MNRPWVLRPGLVLIDRLRTSARLGVLIAVLLVPGVVATWAYTGTINGQVGFTDKERAGVQVLRPALAALATAVSGTAPDLAGLDTAVTANADLALEEPLSTVAAATGSAGRPLSPADRTTLAGALVDLITATGNNSNLILDPDLDSFYVMDAQVVQVPKALLAAATAGSPDTTVSPANQVAEQAVQAGGLTGAAAGIGGDIGTATAHTARRTLARELTGLGQVAAATKSLGTALSGSLDHPAAADPSPVGRAAAAAVDSGTAALDALLAARANHLARDRSGTLAVTVLAMLLGGWLAAAVLWRTRRDVRLATDGVTAIAAGDLGDRPLPDGQDELGDIGRALDTARHTLAGQGAELRRAEQDRLDEMRTSFSQTRRAEKQVRNRAQSLINETTGAVVSELEHVVGQVGAVREATGIIDGRVNAADQVTRAVVEEAGEADRVAAALGESLQKVAGMAVMIAGVADQTKLLALNATIEAARAGSAGKGFTVVASEVKDLAVATARSTEQISETIAVLERDAAAMAAVISRMTGGIDGVNEATAVLRSVAADQRHRVDQLDQLVVRAIERIRTMADLSDQLERRGEERVPASGPVTLRAGTDSVTGRLVNVSSGGLRCTTGVPVTLEPGARLTVTVPVGDGPPLELPATVANKDADDPGDVLGVRFAGLDAPTERRLVAYLDSLTGEPATRRA